MPRVRDLSSRGNAAFSAGVDGFGPTFWRAVVAAIPDGVCIFAVDGVLVGVNEAFCRMTGFSEEELIGSAPPFPYWPGEDLELMRALHEKILRGAVTDFELTVCCKTGERFPAHLHASIIAETGESSGQYFLATIRDITDRARRESDLRRSERRWQSIVENPFDFVTVIDREYKYTYVNHTAPGILLEDLIGKATPFDFIDPAFYSDVRNTMDRSFRDGVATFYEAFSPQLDKWFGSVVGPIFEDGVVTSLSILTRDITDSKRAENAVRQSEHRLRLALAGGDVGAFDLNVLSGEFYCSPHFYRLLGYAEDSSKPPLTLHDFLRRLHPDDARETEATLRLALDTEAPFDAEYRFRTESDGYRWFHGRGRSFRESDGVIRFSGFVTDVTDRRAADDQRVRLEAQLRHAQKLETLGTLAGGIAHDFNNLLVPILGNAQLALRVIEPFAPARSEVEDILRAAARARELVSRILVFGRRAEERREPVSIPNVVREVLAFLKASVPSNIQIAAHFAEDCPSIMGDPNQIHQALTNVCANAYQAIGPSGGHIDINVTTVNLDPTFAMVHAMRKGPAVCVSVKDTGPGITAVVLHRVFEPFFTTKAAGEGSGLGLAMVHAIMSKHGGTATAQSKEGHGAVFELYFPADPHSDARAPVADVPMHAPAAASRIACIDDEPGVLRALVRILKAAGHTVAAYASPVEALNDIRKAPSTFDAVVTDLTMPGIGGIELAVRLAEVRPDLPVILVTGYGEPTLGPGRLSTNIRSCLEKPLDVDALVGAVARALVEKLPGR
jgi:PAS domain S-box-containing protein